MKKAYKVIALSVGTKGTRIHHVNEIIDDLTIDEAKDLIARGFIAPVDEADDKKKSSSTK